MKKNDIVNLDTLELDYDYDVCNITPSDTTKNITVHIKEHKTVICKKTCDPIHCLIRIYLNSETNEWVIEREKQFEVNPCLSEPIWEEVCRFNSLETMKGE